ncbi:MAG: hypothetical protein QOD83_2968 [Solirubrobacteraceae bacterium]|nr:hypothetical protein [Solirubrobacteraceae bacterium]
MADPALTERVLGQRELNRAVLARQHLLARSSATVPRTLHSVGGLQAQYAPSTYVGLWSRQTGLARAELTSAVEKRAAVQATLMRVTIHVVARADFWPFALATREARRALWLKARRGAVSAESMEAAATLVRQRLCANGVVQRKELEQLVGKADTVGVGLWIDLVRVPPSGTWERRRADLFAAAEDWIGAANITVHDATDHLLRRYLKGFGPASRSDIASYTGLRRADIVLALQRLPLRRFSSESGVELLDLPRQPLPDPDTPAPVRFLPTWDATLLVHARRAGILPEEYRPRIFSTKNPHSLPTFLVDGAVAGAWRYAKGQIQLDPFEPLDHSTLKALKDEADRLADFHA